VDGILLDSLLIKIAEQHPASRKLVVVVVVVVVVACTGVTAGDPQSVAAARVARPCKITGPVSLVVYACLGWFLVGPVRRNLSSGWLWYLWPFGQARLASLGGRFWLYLAAPPKIVLAVVGLLGREQFGWRVRRKTSATTPSKSPQIRLPQ
jgi:hypothetical protein